MKKRKRTWLLFLPVSGAIIYLLLILLCSCRERPDEVLKVLVGNVVVIGNEPFTKLAIRTDNDTYILVCDKATTDDLLRLQGYKITVYYTTLTEENGLKNVVLIRYSVWRER